jgi:hypothetical protein
MMAFFQLIMSRKILPYGLICCISKISTFVAEKCKWEMVLELISGVIAGVGTHLRRKNFQNQMRELSNMLCTVALAPVRDKPIWKWTKNSKIYVSRCTKTSVVMVLTDPSSISGKQSSQ